MERKISYYLGQNGYLKMLTTMMEFTVFFKKETGFISMILLVDMEKNPYITEEAVKDVKQKAIWRFRDQGIDEIHPMVWVITPSPEQAFRLGERESFFWILDSNAQRLIIPEGKAEDFYGIKGQLEKWLTADFQPENGEAIAYSSAGRPVVRFRDKPFINDGIFCICLIAFTFYTLFGDVLYNYGRLSILDVQHGQWYRLISCMFLHGDMSHLAGNMIMLMFLGNIMEKEMGHIKYFITYFSAGIAGGIASLCMQYIQLMEGVPNPGSIGASGAIFGMMGGLLWVLICNKGHLKDLTFFKILFLICYTLYGGLTSVGIDNAAHIGGLLTGFIVTILLYRKKKKPEEREECP